MSSLAAYIIIICIGTENSVFVSVGLWSFFNALTNNLFSNLVWRTPSPFSEGFYSNIYSMYMPPFTTEQAVCLFELFAQVSQCIFFFFGKGFVWFCQSKSQHTTCSISFH